eukprot:scpid88140/ scgid2854/ Epidermal growth factor-like protein 6; MAM and EGF domains-containing gene protein
MLLCRNILFCSCKREMYMVGADLECSDIDGCRSVNVTCANYSTCINSVGSYSCECNAGFTTSNSSSPTGEQDCGNVDECYSQPCNHGYKCMDTIGSFSCVCNGEDEMSNGTHCFGLPSNTGQSDATTDTPISISMVAVYACLGVVFIVACILGVLLCKSRRVTEHTFLTASLTSTQPLDACSSHELYSNRIVTDHCEASPCLAAQPATAELPMAPISSSSHDCPEEMGNMVDNDAYGVIEGLN